MYKRIYRFNDITIDYLKNVPQITVVQMNFPVLNLTC